MFVGYKLYIVRYIVYLFVYEILIFNEEGISSYDVLIDYYFLLFYKVKVVGIEMLVVRMWYDFMDVV